MRQIRSRRCFGRGGAALGGARLGYRFVPGGERVGGQRRHRPAGARGPHLDARRLPRFLLRSAFARIRFGTRMARKAGAARVASETPELDDERSPELGRDDRFAMAMRKSAELPTRRLLLVQGGYVVHNITETMLCVRLCCAGCAETPFLLLRTESVPGSHNIISARRRGWVAGPGADICALAVARARWASTATSAQDSRRVRGSTPCGGILVPTAPRRDHVVVSQIGDTHASIGAGRLCCAAPTRNRAQQGKRVPPSVHTT